MIAIALAVLVPGIVFGWIPQGNFATAILVAIVAIAFASALLMRRPYAAAFAVAIAVAMVRLYPGDEARTQTVRSFFGVHKIYDTPEETYRVLMNGTTVHGAQRLTGDDGKPITGRPEPLTYYHANSAMAQVIRAVRARKGAIRVAVIGLGSGSLACYVEPGDAWQFFEIDPSIVAIARDRPRFNFVRACAPDVPIVLGDARLTLAREPDQSYDLIIVDAYSSDAIPIHLATREAMAIYKSKIAPDGIVTLHLSNRNLALDEVAVGIAAANGMKTWIYDDSAEEDNDDAYIYASDVSISANKTEDLGELAVQQELEAHRARTRAARLDRRLFEYRPRADQKARLAELEHVHALTLTSSAPTKWGRGPRVSAVEGASSSRSASAPHAPPPCFAWSALPRAARGGE